MDGLHQPGLQYWLGQHVSAKRRHAGSGCGRDADGELYVVGGITNAHSDAADPFDDSFDRFFNDSEHFMTLELGWTGSQERILLDNTHVTLWRVDDSVASGAKRVAGAASLHARYLDKKWMPFVRGGYAEDGGSLLQKSLSVGVLR